MINKMFNYFSLICGAIGGIALYLLGGFDIILKSLIVLIVLDFSTGILKGFYTKKLSSSVGYKGIIKKIFILIVVVAAVTIQNVINIPIREITIMFFLTNEAISILENIGTVIPIPEKLKSVLEQLRSK